MPGKAGQYLHLSTPLHFATINSASAVFLSLRIVSVGATCSHKFYDHFQIRLSVGWQQWTRSPKYVNVGGDVSCLGEWSDGKCGIVNLSDRNPSSCRGQLFTKKNDERFFEARVSRISPGEKVHR